MCHEFTHRIRGGRSRARPADLPDTCARRSRGRLGIEELLDRSLAPTHLARDVLDARLHLLGHLSPRVERARRLERDKTVTGDGSLLRYLEPFIPVSG